MHLSCICFFFVFLVYVSISICDVFIDRTGKPPLSSLGSKGRYINFYIIIILR